MKKENEFKLNRIQQAIVLLIITAWSTLQPIAVFESIPFEIKLIIFYWKNVLGAVLVMFGVATISFVTARKQKLSFDPTILWLGILFPIFVIFNNLFNDKTQSWEEVALYILWTIAAYLVFPVFVKDEQFLAKILKVILISNLIALFVGMRIGWFNVPYERWLDLSYRLRFDFSNPNIFASSWQVIIPIMFYFGLKNKHISINILTFILVTLALFFVIQARARSTSFFCITVVIIHFFSNRKRPKLLRLTYICFALAASLVFLSQALSYDYDSVNEVSSGRIALWEDTIRLNYKNAKPLDYITGLSRFDVPYYMQKDFRSGFQSSRGQIDNTYLGLFLQHGVLGSVLFLLPIFLINIRLFVALKYADDYLRRLIWLTIGCWFGFALQGTGLAMFPSFGNIVNIFLLPFSAHIYMRCVELLAIHAKNHQHISLNAQQAQPILEGVGG